jgi:uncharacterized coiled-coil protein SlyX
MSESAQVRDDDIDASDASGEDAVSPLEKRIEELEIKLAFMEKELEEYKEASRVFYRRLNQMEDEMRKLEKEVPADTGSSPEATWDRENRQVRP